MNIILLNYIYVYYETGLLTSGYEIWITVAKYLQKWRERILLLVRSYWSRKKERRLCFCQLSRLWTHLTYWKAENCWDSLWHVYRHTQFFVLSWAVSDLRTFVFVHSSELWLRPDLFWPASTVHRAWIPTLINGVVFFCVGEKVLWHVQLTFEGRLTLYRLKFY
jgi:hypothetical protein